MNGNMPKQGAGSPSWQTIQPRGSESNEKKVSRNGWVIHSGNIEHQCGVTLKSTKSKEHCGN